MRAGDNPPPGDLRPLEDPLPKGKCCAAGQLAAQCIHVRITLLIMVHVRFISFIAVIIAGIIIVSCKAQKDSLPPDGQSVSGHSDSSAAPAIPGQTMHENVLPNADGVQPTVAENGTTVVGW